MVRMVYSLHFKILEIYILGFSLDGSGILVNLGECLVASMCMCQ